MRPPACAICCTTHNCWSLTPPGGPPSSRIATATPARARAAMSSPRRAFSNVYPSKRMLEVAPSSKRLHRRKGVVRRQENLQGCRLRDDARQEEAIQLPAGILRLAAVDDVIRVLRPIGARVGVGHGQPGALVKLAVEDLARFAEVGGGFVRIDRRPLPARRAGIAAFIDQHVGVAAVRAAQRYPPARVVEGERGGRSDRARLGSLSPPYSQAGAVPNVWRKSTAFRAHQSLAFPFSVIPGGNITVRCGSRM